jgi:hypothetical protein
LNWFSGNRLVASANVPKGNFRLANALEHGSWPLLDRIVLVCFLQLRIYRFAMKTQLSFHVPSVLMTARIPIVNIISAPL